MFEYLPLKAGEQTGRLSFSSSELGVYQYDLNLTATPAGTEAPVHFRAGLGTSQSQTCRFVNFAKSKVEYSCKVNTSFTLFFFFSPVSFNENDVERDNVLRNTTNR